MSESSWYILGAGAIGGLFAHALSRRGVPCTLLLRDHSEPECQLTLEREGQRQVCTFPVSTAGDHNVIDKLLVCTKAYDVASALGAIRHRTGPDTEVLLLVNGMGVTEIAAGILPQASLFSGTTTEGAYRIQPRHIHHAGSGITLVGSPDKISQPQWFATWQSLSLDCRWEADIERALWHKLAINCAINPLTAIHGCRNGELARDEKLRREVTSLCDEIAAVSHALGFTHTAQIIHSASLEVIQATAENRSSMLQDTLAGGDTEIEFITGYLVRRAEEAGLAVPHNHALLETIRNASRP